MTAVFPALRLRRLRQHPVLRDLIREIELNISDLVLPLFIKNEIGEKQPISSMPGHFQIPLSALAEEIKEIAELKINSVILFGIPDHKDAMGTGGYHDDGIIQKAVEKIRSLAPDLLIITDVCFCQYTDHGHCGAITEENAQAYLDNDATLELLVKQAVSHARAGVDVVAPSGMIDGMVHAIRRGLDENGFNHIPILSYSAKYSSAMYGPFRLAAEGAPKFGDRSTYQMDYGNAREALREVEADVCEGADMLMVKPAHTYLDVICKVKQAYPHVPLAAYHTSGEFSMIKAAAANGWIDEKKAAIEVLTSIKRAGADFIITYYAKEVTRWLRCS